MNQPGRHRHIQDNYNVVKATDNSWKMSILN